MYGVDGPGTARLCGPDYPDADCDMIKCPYGKPGDRLWVRETWCLKEEDGRAVYNSEGNLDSTCCWYLADGVHVVACDGDGFQRYRKDGTEASPWSPSIHMPRWASRITLEIKGVRVEQLHDMKPEDPVAEGCPRSLEFTPCDYDQVIKDAAEDFPKLWNSINEKRGFGWNKNPWVWVIEFERIEATT